MRRTTLLLVLAALGGSSLVGLWLEVGAAETKAERPRSSDRPAPSERAPTTRSSRDRQSAFSTTAQARCRATGASEKRTLSTDTRGTTVVRAVCQGGDAEATATSGSGAQSPTGGCSSASARTGDATARATAKASGSGRATASATARSGDTGTCEDR